jgi:hypothetical protein
VPGAEPPVVVVAGAGVVGNKGDGGCGGWSGVGVDEFVDDCKGYLDE